MPLFSRISVTLDAPNHLLLVRLFSLHEAREKAPDIIDHLRQIGEPWIYHAIFDFRRYEADLTPERLDYLVGKWVALEANRDIPRALAVITSDPEIASRLKPVAVALPHRSLMFFDSFDEGLDWVKGWNMSDAA